MPLTPSIRIRESRTNTIYCKYMFRLIKTKATLRNARINEEEERMRIFFFCIGNFPLQPNICCFQLVLTPDLKSILTAINCCDKRREHNIL